MDIDDTTTDIAPVYNRIYNWGYQVIRIQSWDQLIDTGVKLVLEQIPHEQLKFTEDLIFKIKIQGPSWDGAIDYRGAYYVLELQRAVNQLYTELRGETIPLRSLSKLVTVKVKVVQGCSFYEIDLNEVLNNMVGSMTGGELLIFTGICAATIGAMYTVKKVIDYKTRVKLDARAAQKDESIVERLSSSFDRALDVIERKDFEAPTRKLVARLEQQDTITLPNRDPLPAEAAKQVFPRRARSKRHSGRFDAAYTINNINLAETPPVFTLAHNNIQFDAAAELAGTDIEHLTSQLDGALKDKTTLNVPLHVFILYSDRRIISAAIQGTGEPRDGTEDIDNLVFI